MDFQHNENSIAYIVDGNVLAKVEFPPFGDNIVQITHTFVDGSLRGQGIAGKLMQTLVEDLRDSKRKAVVLCSYAAGWFEKNPQCSDVLLTEKEEDI